MSEFHLSRYGRALLQRALTGKPSHAFFARLGDYLKRELQVDNVTIERCTHGSHWISVPLKVNVQASGRTRSFFVKVITEKGLRNFNYAVESRNVRVRILGDACRLRYKKAASRDDILSYEAETLTEFRTAGINAPKPLTLFEVGFHSLLMLEYIRGAPLGEGSLQRKDALQVLQIVRRLRDNTLVHGDIKLDNFLRAADRSVYLIDCLSWTGSLRAAMHYDLASALYSLSRKLEPFVVLQVAHQLFTAAAIHEALELIDLAGVQADALTDRDVAYQIKSEMQFF